MSASAGRQPKHYAGLDVIRSVACLVVLVSHLLGESVQKFVTLPQPLARAFKFFFVNAEGGVKVFFALSGFLITHLLLEERRRSGRLDLGAFWLRRALRIWPLYVVVLVLGFVVWPRLGFVPAEHFWPFAVFGGNFEELSVARSGEPSIIVAPTWSISIEEQFYLVWPLLLSALQPRGRTSWAIGALLVAACGSFVLFAADPAALAFHTLPNLLPLALGAAGALAATRADVVARVVALRKQATAVTVALVVLATQLHGSQSAAALFGTTLIISVLAAFWCVVAVSDPREPATLGVRLLVRLAKYTYALYLLQTTAGLAVRWLARSYGVTDASPLTMPLGVLQMALALALAVASYHLLERPFVKLREARSPTP